MGKRDRKQLLDDHQEWIDHMYNPGYWINRIGYAQKGHWRWVRRHHRLVGGLGALSSGVLIVLSLMNGSENGLNLSPSTWLAAFDLSQPENFAGLFGLLSALLIFIASLLLFFRRQPAEPVERA